MPQSPVLIVQNGPNKGNSYPLGDTITIGRDKTNSISLDDQRISRHHCEIWREENIYKLKDLNSKNGSYVNNLLVKEIALNSGDTILTGETLLTFYYTPVQQCTTPVSFLPQDPKQTLIVRKLPGAQIRELKPQLLAKLVHEKTIQDLAALYHTSFSIYTIRNIDKLLARVLELIFKAVPAERSVILLSDGDKNKLEPHAVRLKKGETKTEIKISSTITNEVFQENVSLLTKDAQADKRFDTKTSILQEAIKSAICVPISTAETTFGVIYLDTKTTTAAFTEDTLRLITAIANQVAIAIENLRFHEELQQETHTLSKELKQTYNMVGISKQMKNVFNLISKAAPTNSIVLITGESGTGKELVARAIHYNSPRKNKPFICVNCTTLPETLIESELFGHEKGAFTGAHATKPGQFELANKGTLFLDEIGEMPQESQMKLLRVLEESKVRHVGGTKDIPVDVRVIAASNKNLEKEVKNGSFREDLYYRLKVINIELSPLRERKDDITLLTKYYYDMFKPKATHPIKGISSEAMNVMEKYSWPGNIRELKNCIERALVMSKKDYIGPKDLDLIPQAKLSKENSPIPTLYELEKEHILKAIGAAEGNKTKAAEILGIRRSTLYEKLKLYKIE